MKKPRYTPENSVNVKDFEGVKRWYGLTGNRRFEFDKSTRMHDDNRVEFKRMFGPRHQTVLDVARYDVWRIEFEGLYFWLLSAKARGTIIRVEKTKDWGVPQVKKVVAFLDYVYSELKELSHAY
jgi:hypothetical protein